MTKSLPVTTIHGVGPATKIALHSLGIHTVDQLAKMNFDTTHIPNAEALVARARQTLEQSTTSIATPPSPAMIPNSRTDESPVSIATHSWYEQRVLLPIFNDAGCVLGTRYVVLYEIMVDGWCPQLSCAWIADDDKIHTQLFSPMYIASFNSMPVLELYLEKSTWSSVRCQDEVLSMLRETNTIVSFERFRQVDRWKTMCTSP